MEAERKFAYNELDIHTPVVVTESHIRETYWPYWLEQMKQAQARGQENALSAELTWENCLDDWIVVNWAWEVKDDGSN